MDLDQKILKDLFNYDETLGSLIYKYRERKHFKTKNACAVFNSKFCGKAAGSLDRGKSRYSKLQIFGKTYLTHRIIYKWFNGIDCEEVDHINGKTFDNRIENLKASNSKLNKLNQKLPSHNTSGYLGVSLYRGKWRAGYMLDYKTICVGVFNCPTKAYLELLKARENAGFSKNHGER